MAEKETGVNGKNLKVAGVLLAILLALGGIATWDERQTVKDAELKSTEKRLVEFSVDEVSEFTFVSRPSTERAEVESSESEVESQVAVNVTLAKVDGLWRVVRPVDMRADDQAVDNFLRSLADYQYEKVVASGADQLAAFGLKDAAREVSLKFANGRPTATIFVGAKAPVGFSVYVRASTSDDVMLGGQHLLTALSKSLHEFRDKTLVRIDEPTLTSLTYRRKDGDTKIALTHQDGRYTLLGATEEIEIDPGEVKDFVDDLNAVRIERFIDAPSVEEKKAFLEPAYSVSWQAKGGAAQSLNFILANEKVMAAYAASDVTEAFELPIEFRAKVQKSVKDFRNKRIIRISSDDIKSLQIDGDNYKSIGGEWYKATDAAKFDGEKFMGKPEDKPAGQAHLRALLVDLEFAKTVDFYSPEDQAIKSLPAAPLHRIQLSTKADGTSPITVDLFSDVSSADKYFVKVFGRDQIYHVLKSAFVSLVPGQAPPDGGTVPEVEGMPDPSGFEEMPPEAGGESLEDQNQG